MSSSALLVPAGPPGTPVYLSAPIALVGTPGWPVAVSRLATLVPTHPIRSAPDLFRSRGDWRAHFPEALQACGALIFLTEPDGWFGKGVDAEIAAARAIGLPIAWLTPEGDLVPLRAVHLGPAHDADWTRYRQASRIARPPSPDVTP